MSRPRWRAAGVGALAAVALGACSSGGSGAGSTNAGAAGTAAAGSSSTASPGSPGGSGSGGSAGPSSGYDTTCDTPRTLPQRTQTSLAVDPTDDKVVYVGVEQSGFYKSTNGGLSWIRASTGIKSRTSPKGACFSEFYSTRIDPKNPLRLLFGLVGGPGTLGDFNARAEGPYLSTDGGATWRQLVADPSINTSSYAVVADPRDPNVMYAGVNGNRNFMSGQLSNSKGVIYKTTDGGASWVELDTGFVEGMRCNQLEVDPRSPDTVYAGIFVLPPNGGSQYAATQPGILKSTDGGKTWVSKIQGFDTSDPARVAIQRLALSALAPDRLYAACFSGAYTSQDGGETWSPSGRGLAVVAFDPNDPTGARLVGLDPHASELHESRDGGTSWTAIGKLPPEAVAGTGTVSRITDLEVSHQARDLIYMSEANGRVWKSLDGGGTWVRVLSGDMLPP